MTYTKRTVGVLFCANPRILGEDRLTLATYRRHMAQLQQFLAGVTIKPFLVWQGKDFDVDWKSWQQLAQTIATAHATCDGFVVLHGAARALSAANLISFMLHESKKSIIFFPIGRRGQQTGKKLAFLEQERQLLIDLVHAAILGPAGVAILDRYMLLTANQTSINRTSGVEALEQPRGVFMSHLQFGAIHYALSHRSSPQRRIRCFDRVAPRIMTITFTEMLSPLVVNPDQLDGLLIPYIPVEHWPQEFRRALERVSVPVLITGVPSRPLPKRLAHCVIAPPMTPEAAEAKWAWALGQTRSLTELKRLMQRNVAGECGVHV